MIGNVFKSIFGTQSQNSDIRPGLPQSLDSADILVVTTMHSKGYAEYGKGFVSSFLRHWPKNHRLVIYAEGFDVEIDSSRVEVLDLHQEIPSLEAFKRKHSAIASRMGHLASGYDYRFDAVRFANKSYVLAHVARQRRSRYMLWLDADTVTFQDIPPRLVERLLDGGDFMAYLGRFGTHSEAGFMPFDLDAKAAPEFFDALVGLYESGQIFESREWHDSHLIDCCRVVLAGMGKLTARNLNVHQTGHPFVNSAPGLFMDHMKGPNRKSSGRSSVADLLIPPYWRVNFYAGRYGQLPELLRLLLPTSIIEVGTWSGWRAVQMSLISLEADLPVHYRGFDVFEHFSKEFDEAEKNVKPHFSKTEVSHLLEIVRDVYPSFSFDLVRGNTRDTLKDECVDFVFLDGGHSVETIASDFQAVRRSSVVVLDDYYDGGIDTTSFGCNRLVQDQPHVLLPVRDPVSGGGTTQFALTASSVAKLDGLRAQLIG